MAVEIKTETIEYHGRSTMLVSVKNGEAAIGICSAGYNGLGGANAINKIFFIGNDPIVNIVCPARGNNQSDKMLAVAPGFVGYDQKINAVINGCFDKLNGGEALTTGMRDIFNMLQDGVYAVYLSDYYPTDGNSSFFWGAYNILHDVHGTAEHGRVVGQRTFKPCFLIPSQPLDYYAPKTKVNTDDLVKRRKIQGIVYHLSGFHSVVLKGHHGAVCCVDNEVPFTCAVIEKICEPYTKKFVPPQPAAAPVPDIDPDNPEAAPSEEAAAAPPPVSVPIAVPEGITGFRCASLKLPLDVFPKDMLRMLIEERAEYKPRQFDILIAKLNTVRKKALSNNVLPFSVLEKTDTLPDCDMVESAYAIDGLSDEQLDHLLAGDVECNGEIIISPNFYSSIVTACNYLQFTDMKRFVDFSIAILDNPELSATHEYVAHRALSQISNKKLGAFFAGVVSSRDAKYEKIMTVAQTFMERSKNR
ncbi:MAG: hypothetical protein K2N56_05575 [Oscillospiraceae bacterium]|nr:hypothetical protein [Oscillospiraceae bacterium]